MKLRNALASAAVLAVGTFALAPAASAAPGDTVATFTITGLIAVTVPSSADLATVATGATSASGQLGPVTVEDTRGVAAAWSTTVSTTTFTTGAGTPNQTVLLPKISYGSGPATAQTGIGGFVPLPTIVMAGADSTRTINLSGGDGMNSTTWNPTLTFSLLSTQKAGTYTGTITHSVV